MGRKYRPGKARVITSFPYRSLSLADMLRLGMCEEPYTPVTPKGKDRLITRADFEAAYRENRDLLLKLKDTTTIGGHIPGERPWLYWQLERGMAEVPEDQITELHRLGELSREERRRLVELMDLYGWAYSDAQKQLMETWREGPKDQPAAIIEFPADEDDGE